jgi:hypothetical protein
MTCGRQAKISQNPGRRKLILNSILRICMVSGTIVQAEYPAVLCVPTSTDHPVWNSLVAQDKSHQDHGRFFPRRVRRQGGFVSRPGATTVERNEEFCCKPGRFSVISMLLWVFIGRGKGRFRLKEALLGLCQLSGRKLKPVMCSEGFNAPVTARESSDQPSRVWD